MIDESNKIKGSVITTYLLEKSRVIEPSNGERNYHIFYHLLEGASKEMLDKLFLSSKMEEYEILKKSKLYKVPNINDTALFQEINNSYKVLFINYYNQ